MGVFMSMFVGIFVLCKRTAKCEHFFGDIDTEKLVSIEIVPDDM